LPGGVPPARAADGRLPVALPGLPQPTRRHQAAGCLAPAALPAGASETICGYDGGKKISSLVKFPVAGLDLDRRVYNLYGVCNHYGRADCGHYTAACLNAPTNAVALFSMTTKCRKLSRTMSSAQPRTFCSNRQQS
uniref:UCH domain-containing protein n=1 Tax=Macrostomum lignano TaxID=282301 RepID=A0A1I8FLA9_9PLAT